MELITLGSIVLIVIAVYGALNYEIDVEQLEKEKEEYIWKYDNKI